MNFIKSISFQKKPKQFLIGLLAGILITFLSVITFSVIQAENETSLTKAVNYIKSKKQDAWTSLALAAADESNISLDHLKDVLSDSPLEYSKAILVLAAFGNNPAKFGREDYIEKLKGFYKGTRDSGQFGDQKALNDDVWAILALGSLGKDYSYRVLNARRFLLENQNSDGGWGWAVGGPSDTNSTAATIMALLETGLSPDSSEIVRAINYLKANQNSDGGFPFSWQQESDSCSDAWVVSSIYKLGQDPKDWVKNGKNPLEHLLSLQNSDGGFLWKRHDRTSSLMCTNYAVIALTGKFYPVISRYNRHQLIIEGEKTLCHSNIYGATPMELVINGSKVCKYSYWISNQWEDKYGSLYLEEINGKKGWHGYVNHTFLSVGFDSFYLAPNDEVLIKHVQSESDQTNQDESSTKTNQTSQKVKLKVEIEQPKSINFSIKPKDVDFKKLKPGQTLVQEIEITNLGDRIFLKAEVSGSVFKENLKINEVNWQNFSLELDKGQKKKVPLRLTLPSHCQDFGTKEGELVFEGTLK